MKLAVIVLVLLALGGAGYYYYYMRKEEPSFTVEAKSYPESAIQLKESVSISKGRKGYITITGANSSDLLFAQGVHHGKRCGKQLSSLRSLFKGKPGAGPCRELRQLSEFFYYLDLEHVAAACTPLYSIQVNALLQSYAEGLNKGSASEEPWTSQDVLLMQRGLAFLAGRNLIKEWSANELKSMVGEAAFSQLSPYPPGEMGGLDSGARLAPALEILATPFFETVRSLDVNGLLGLQTRTHPMLSFLYEPMTLELDGRFRVQGLSISGLPFLWSGRNASITFHPQPILANDEQFFELTRTAFVGRSGQVLRNDKATYVDEYAGPPIHSRFGRNLSQLISSREGTHVWYYWDGFRPSADLAALYYLMTASGVDAALTAFQYHQVPATELLVQTRAGQTAYLTCFPSDPDKAAEERQTPFLGPEVRFQIPTYVRGSGIAGNQTVRLHLQSQQLASASELDEDLVLLLQFYLRDGRIADVLGQKAYNRFNHLLASARSPTRDYLVQLMWYYLQDWLTKEGRGLNIDSGLIFKRYLLATFGRSRAGVETVALPQSARRQIVTELLAKAYSDLSKTPRYSYLKANGKPATTNTQLPVQSSDAPAGAFFCEGKSTVSLVSGYNLVWADKFYYWYYPFLSNNTLGRPSRVDVGGSTESIIISPEL